MLWGAIKEQAEEEDEFADEDMEDEDEEEDMDEEDLVDEGIGRSHFDLEDAEEELR